MSSTRFYSCFVATNRLRLDSALVGRRGKSRRLGATPCERLQSVVCGVLVRVAERGEVEDALDEVVERPAERHHARRDVDQLARALADDRHAENALVVRIEEQFEEAVGVAE